MAGRRWWKRKKKLKAYRVRGQPYVFNTPGAGLTNCCSDFKNVSLDKTKCKQSWRRRRKKLLGCRINVRTSIFIITIFRRPTRFCKLRALIKLGFLWIDSWRRVLQGGSLGVLMKFFLENKIGISEFFEIYMMIKYLESLKVRFTRP